MPDQNTHKTAYERKLAQARIEYLQAQLRLENKQHTSRVARFEAELAKAQAKVEEADAVLAAAEKEPEQS